MVFLHYSKHLLILPLLLIGCANSGYASGDSHPFPGADDRETAIPIRSATAVSFPDETTTRNADPLSSSMIAGGRRVGLDASHIVNIRQKLADEHERGVNDMIYYRSCFRKIANWNEAIGNAAGYLGMAATPLAGAVMLVPATAVASPYIILTGSIAIGVKVFCMGLASCSAREAAERHQTLEQLASAIGARPVDITPTITGPETQSEE